MESGWEIPWERVPLVVFDVETTGLAPREGDRVCELAALRWEEGAVRGHISTLVNPGRPIPPEATAVHGISDADVAAAPPWEEARAQFVAFARGALLAAYNLPFDLSFLATPATAGGPEPVLNPTADVLALARRLMPGLASYHLGDVAAALGISNPSPHRALGDVAVTSEVALALLAALRDAGQARTAAEVVRYSRGLEGTAATVELLAAIEWALAAAVPLGIDYYGSAGPSRRWVTPLGVYARAGRAYLRAYCHQRQERRDFRFDRIANAALGDPSDA